MYIAWKPFSKAEEKLLQEEKTKQNKQQQQKKPNTKKNLLISSLKSCDVEHISSLKYLFKTILSIS